MPWTIERKHPHVAVVTMNTNKVNAQNPAFFADLHAAFDRLEAEFNDCAVVLTGSGAVFTAGETCNGWQRAGARKYRARRRRQCDSFRHHRCRESQPRYVHAAVRAQSIFIAGDIRRAVESNLCRGAAVFVAQLRGTHDHYLCACNFHGAFAALTAQNRNLTASLFAK